MATLIVTLVAPLVWSAAVVLLRRLSTADAHPDDRVEKRYLLILLAPVLLAPAAVGLAHWLPLPVQTARIVALAATGQGAPAGQALLRWLPTVCLTIYALGLLAKAGPLALQFLALHRIVGRSRPSSIAPNVRLTEADVPPLAWGRGTVLLPQGLVAQLPPAQIDLLIAHERAHIQRGDIAWFARLSWIDAVFWFNPFVRHQTGRCRLAAELACDAAVTRAAPAMREVYAACLLTALKHAAGDPWPGKALGAPAVVSTPNSGEFKMRMTEIMRNSAVPRKPRWLVQGLLAVLVLPVAGVQYAWSQDSAAKPVAAETPDCLAKGCVVIGSQIVTTEQGVTAQGDAQLVQNGRAYHAAAIQTDTKTGQVSFSGPVIVTETTQTVALNAAPDASGSNGSRQAGTVRIVRPPEDSASADTQTNIVTVPVSSGRETSGAVIIVQPKSAVGGSGNRIIVMPPIVEPARATDSAAPKGGHE